ncbi:sensor histidine kinase [Neptuniibacter halophilus]|uniref:sensor histidine kinase n=1 Tax=Neptuniibacter halophilus TaxID=651666 RepID=UPI0025738A10|nr:ATP-binding protein [Neptuniibacter halophilus]
MLGRSAKVPAKIISGRLGKRIAILIVVFSSCFTLLSTSLQLGLDYRADISRIEQQFNNIRTSYLQAITLSVWSLDDSQIETQLVGLSQLPDIEYVAILVEDEIAWEQGEAVSSTIRNMDFPLNYSAPGISAQDIGKLRITASIDNVYNRLLQKAGVILVSNGIKTFLVSGFILLLIWLLITRHLQTISDYLRDLDFSRHNNPLKLNKRQKDQSQYDEIDNVVQTINHMGSSLEQTYRSLHENKLHLQQLVEERDTLLEKELHHKEQLEQRVMERTQQLQNSMDDLRSAQDLLIETEKMAALGNMVAGVAHEINTPIGVCRTAASFQGENAKLIRQKMAEGTLTQSDLRGFLDEVEESSHLFESNIIKASNLISSFKLIATDQSYDAKQKFNLHNYLQSSIQTIYPQYKHQKVRFNLQIPEDIQLNSYPGALHHIISNLINNSILHGFEQKQGGNIVIHAECEGDHLILDYRDDGRGLTAEEQKKLFEPFFTTKRGQGGSGLGMSIVFNIISRQLGGRAELPQEETPGFHLRMHIPIEAKELTSTETGN